MEQHKYLYNPCPKEWKGKPFLSQENRQEAMSANSKHDAVERLIHNFGFAVHDETRHLDDSDIITITLKIRANDSAGTIEAYWLKESNNEQAR